jgi:hypothetical protein
VDVYDATALAIAWADDGFGALPVAIAWDAETRQTRKRPLLDHGHRDASCDHEQLVEMFADAPARLRPGELLAVGLWPGPAGYVVIDFDTKNHKAGGETLKRLLGDWPDLAICRYRSCSGALNAIVRKPDGCGPIGNAVPADWLGTDVRADAGWIVAPGVSTPWGIWDFDEGSVNCDEAWEMAPEFAALLGAATPGRRPATSPEIAAYIAARAHYTSATRSLVDETVGELRAAANGSRHGTLLHAVGRIVGLDHVDLADALEQIQTVWDALTVHEGREREPVEVLAWVIGQEHAADDLLGDDAPPTDEQHQEEESGAHVGRVAPTLAQLLTEGSADHDWLIPDLLERGDRTILTGLEGYGKSTLLRQICLGAALGVNTLDGDVLRRHPPIRALLVDLENSPRQLRREFTKAMQAIPEERRAAVAERLYVESRPEGLILDSHRDPDGDRAWLEETIVGTIPELLVIGPLYKMIVGEPNDELPNRELVKWLDRLRITHALTLMLEAHSPHREKRPYGWSGWKRWPEFGLHLDRSGELTHWRGQREERAWPQRLSRSSSGGWLWTPATGTTSMPAADPYEEHLAQASLEVIRVLRAAKHPLSRQEIADRVPRRKAFVVTAIARLEDRDALIVTLEDRTRSHGRPYPTEVLAIDPTGPLRDTQ